MSIETDTGQPLLRVVAGGVPDDEHLAALVAVLTAVAERDDATSSIAAASRWRGGTGGSAFGREGWRAAARRSALRRAL